MAWRILCLVVAFAVTEMFAAEGLIDAPQKLELERATYRKITIKWEYPADETQIANYRIYRDGKEISHSTETVFTDTSVVPGKSYEYSVDAVTTGGKSSNLSTPLKVKTFNSTDFSQHEQVETVVDSLHSMPVQNLTALSLFSAIKAGFESLTGGALAMNTFDTDLVNQMISEELQVIKTAVPDWTDAERIAAQAELDECLRENFGNHSTEQVYIYDRLITLAEAHWAKGHQQAATLLYDFSLNFLNDQEKPVLNTLQRLAFFKEAALTEESNVDQLENVLAAATAERMRYFDFFPDSVSTEANNLYHLLAIAYFKYFPRLLSYDDYREQAFQAASSAAAQVAEHTNNSRLQEKIDAWRLVQVKLTFRDAAGNPRQGTIKIVNVTADFKPEVFPGDPYYEERTISVNGETEVPVYAGHIYEITAHIPVPGGNDLILSLPQFPQTSGQKVVYDSCNDPVYTTLPEDAAAEAEIVIADSLFPYNLSFERNIDVFKLSWDWVDSETFQAVAFKVFNGENLVAEVSSCHADNIRLATPDGNYQYTVVAVNANGELSAASRPLLVEPGDQSAYAEFFAWLAEYFGDLPVLSSDDSDGDGVDNYHEFLNGTDPTRAPAPTPREKQITYTKLTLDWSTSTPTPAGTTWEIRRNDTGAGTVSTPYFTDSDLLPGVEYVYQIRSLSAEGVRSDWSMPLRLRTLKNETLSHGATLQQVVDLFHPFDPGAYTAPSLISAVKSAVESVLGTSITFSVLDENLLEKMVHSELTLVQEIAAPLTAAERVGLRQELTQIMNENFGGNSFEHLYMHEKLLELAENHWGVYLEDRTRTAHRSAAEALLNAALEVLPNHRPSVYLTLNRLALMQCQALTENSSRTEISNALSQQATIWLRYFDFFSSFTEDIQNAHPYFHIISNNCRYFPIMLAYNQYDHELFATTKQLADALALLPLELSSEKVVRRVSAWNLVPVSIRVDAAGAPSGTLTFRNVSNRLTDYNVGCDMTGDIRTLNLLPGTTELPVYGGHWYELELTTPVPGGPDWLRRIGPLFLPAGERIVYDPFNGITREVLSGETQGAEFHLQLELPEAPYNLEAEVLPDALSLTWDWVAPDGFALDHFKVYRGNTPVGTTTTQTLTGIPRLVMEDSAYAYTVTAVSATGAETRHSPPLRVLPDFTEEEQTYFEWKQHYFGDAPTLATDDPDGDGLTNYQEFLLGSNPCVAPPDSLPENWLEQQQSGAQVAYYEGSWYYLPDFSTLRPFRTAVVNNFCFAATTGEIPGSGRSDHIGMVITGFFEVPQDGSYKFFMSNDDAARFAIDGAIVIDNNRPVSPQEYLAEIPLKKGPHAFRIEYVENEDSARLLLDWAGPGWERRPFAGETIRHASNTLGQEALEYLQWLRDTDHDGIADADELKLGTDWKSRDTDGDGLSDWEEIHRYQTDPTKADTDGNGLSDYEEALVFGQDPVMDLNMMQFEKFLEIPGSTFVNSIGHWQQAGASVEATGRRGTLEYEMELTEGGILKLVFSLHNRTSNAKDTEIDVYVDDIFCGTRRLESFSTSVVTPFFHTPYLAAGTHRIRLEWDNYRNAMALVVDRLELFRIRSRALEAEAQPQLLTRLLQNRSTITTGTESRVSPCCLEGESLYPGLVRINQTLAAQELGSRSWYANVPLQEGTNTLTVAFENGGYQQEHAITWSATNLLHDNPGTLRIRKGDSLRLTVAPAAVTDGSWQITGGPVEINGNATSTVVQKFDAAGTYMLTGIYTAPTGETQEATLQLEVIDYQFKRADVALWQTWKREWQEEAAPESVHFQFDDRLRDVTEERSDTQTSFQVFTDDNQPRYAAARLGGATGPILAVQKISGIGIYSSYQTVVQPGEEYEDGSKEFIMTVVCSPVRPDVELRMNIFVAGVIFDDGTVSKVLRSTDFDATGTTEVRFIRDGEATGSVCHNMAAYQNNEYMGIRTR